MNARICDRCGAAYTPDQGKGHRDGGWKYNMIRFESCSHNHSFEIDLCTKCMGYMFDYLKNDSDKEMGDE